MGNSRLTDDELITVVKANLTPDVSEHLTATPDKNGVAVFVYTSPIAFNRVDVFLERQPIDTPEKGTIRIMVDGEFYGGYEEGSGRGFYLSSKLNGMLPLISSCGPPKKSGTVVTCIITMSGYVGNMNAVIRTF